MVSVRGSERAKEVSGCIAGKLGGFILVDTEESYSIIPKSVWFCITKGESDLQEYSNGSEEQKMGGYAYSWGLSVCQFDSLALVANFFWFCEALTS